MRVGIAEQKQGEPKAKSPDSLEVVRGRNDQKRESIQKIQQRFFKLWQRAFELQKPPLRADAALS